jgi:hypothetical protein
MREFFQKLKEPTMKLTTLLNRSVIATLLLSASVSAFAGGGGGPRGSQPGWHPYANTASAPAPLLAEVDVTSASAYAAPAPHGQGDGAAVAAGTAVHGKTRAQVRAELLQAEEAGWIPAGNTRYPPSAETMARNRAQFQQAEKWWKADGQLNASSQ